MMNSNWIILPFRCLICRYGRMTCKSGTHFIASTFLVWVSWGWKTLKKQKTSTAQFRTQLSNIGSKIDLDLADLNGNRAYKQVEKQLFLTARFGRELIFISQVNFATCDINVRESRMQITNLNLSVLYRAMLILYRRIFLVAFSVFGGRNFHFSMKSF